MRHLRDLCRYKVIMNIFFQFIPKSGITEILAEFRTHFRANPAGLAVYKNSNVLLHIHRLITGKKIA